MCVCVCVYVCVCVCVSDISEKRLANIMLKALCHTIGIIRYQFVPSAHIRAGIVH